MATTGASRRTPKKRPAKVAERPRDSMRPKQPTERPQQQAKIMVQKAKASNSMETQKGAQESRRQSCHHLSKRRAMTSCPNSEKKPRKEPRYRM